MLPRFFGAMAANLTFEAFEPTTLVPSGNHVVVQMQLAFTVHWTGRKIDEEQLDWWTPDAARSAS